MLYLVTRRRENSMISSVMRHLKAVQVVPADMVDLILMVLILAIYSEIYLEICLAAAAEAAVVQIRGQ